MGPAAGRRPKVAIPSFPSTNSRRDPKADDVCQCKTDADIRPALCAGRRYTLEGRAASIKPVTRNCLPSGVLADAYWSLPFDLQDGTWSCGIGFAFGAGTPAVNPAWSSRAYTAWVSSQSMNRFFTRWSIAFLTAAR